jgi:hypothetical protein
LHKIDKNSLFSPVKFSAKFLLFSLIFLSIPIP